MRQLAALGSGLSWLKLSLLLLALANLAVPVALWFYNYSLTQLLLAMVLLDICVYPAFRYFTQKDPGLPIMAVLCLSFAVQYAIPIFTQEQRVLLVWGFRYLNGTDIKAALILSILGVLAMQITYFCIPRISVVTALPKVNLNLDRNRTAICSIALFVLSLGVGTLTESLSHERQLQISAIINLMQIQGLIAIALFAWLTYGGNGQRWHKIVLYLMVAIAVTRGLATTMLEVALLPIAVLLMAEWLYRQRLPVVTLLILGALFLLVSPVKREVRGYVFANAASGRETPATQVITYLAARTAYCWWDILRGRRDFAKTNWEAANRTDIIHSFAHIHSLTPSAIPYQYGRTYSYLTIAWIPRIVWPEKPQANYANNFYAVAYEVNSERGLKYASNGVSIMGEGYINFGLPGVILIMAFLGLITALLEHVFAGVGGQAILIVMYADFLNGIGTSTELMFGSLLQKIICCSLLLWWAREKQTGQIRIRSLSELPD